MVMNRYSPSWRVFLFGTYTMEMLNQDADVEVPEGEEAPKEAGEETGEAAA